LLYRLAYKPNRNRVIVQNVEDRDYFVDRNIFRRADVALIRGSGVDVVRFALCSEPATIPVVGLASRMLREKGVVDFVAAASELKRQGVQARFVLIGDPDFGNPDSHTVEELQQWAAAGAVEWWGKQNNMADVLARCHIVTLPTYYGEGVPKVLIEAAAVGRPIVTTNLPGCRDIVRDEVNGILIAPRDSHLLADALARLIANPQLRVEMGVRGRALVEQEFSLHIVIKQTFDLYDSLLGA
jgi:glycosyltransferase involved in cell wall biosynthesis